MPRLAIVSTHPIQYNAPLFRQLASEQDLQLRVFYTWSQTEQGNQFDPDFGMNVQWDIPLLSGYDFIFVDNIAKKPGSDHFFGVVNPELKNKIAAWKPDYLLVYTWSLYSHLEVVRYFSGKLPLIFRGDSNLLDERPGIRKILRRLLLRWVYSHIDMAFYVGTRNKDYYLAHGMSEDMLHYVPHAVENDRFGLNNESLELEALQRRKELGIENHQKVILFAGKLESKKDPHCLIRISKMLKSENLRFLFAGNGHLESDLRRDAEGDNRIHFLGFQNQASMPLIYRLADVVILPSLYNETWGLAVNEAMACSRPVIVSDRSGCSYDLIDEGISGWIFSPGPEGDLKICNILDRLLSGDIDTREMGIEALAKVSTFSIQTASKAMHEAIIRDYNSKNNSLTI